MQPAPRHDTEDRAEYRRGQDVDQCPHEHHLRIEARLGNRRGAVDDCGDLPRFKPDILAQRKREEHADDGHRQAAAQPGQSAAQPDDIREPRGSTA
jgi:hypothetical protein